VNALFRESRGRLALRAVLLVAPLLALICTGPDEWPHGWFVALMLALSVGFAAMPESMLGSACLGLVVVWWSLAVRDGVPLTAIPAAALLLAAHVASLLLSYGPPALPIGRGVLRLWLRRAVTVGVAAPLVWAVAVVVDGQPEPPGIWVAGLGCAIVVCVVAAAAVSVREPEL
jgi:hypothetical protein